MPPAPLFTRHDASSQTRYQELKRLARAQRGILAGTPGILKQRSRRGTAYWVREYVRADSRKDDEYLGTVAAARPERIEELRAAIQLGKALAAGSSLLRVLGYQRADRKTAAVLAALFNRGLFEAGLVLVGSHAYGSLLNECGIMAPGYATRDIDVARPRPLSIALPAGVDFLVPGSTPGEVIPVKELGAHAQAIPLLDFLVKEPVEAIILSPNQVVPVRVPSPERFALHKLYSSQSRTVERDKIRKDLGQAAVLLTALEEETPGRLGGALRGMPSAGRTRVARGARAAASLIGDSHPEAHALLERLSRRTASSQQ